MICECGSKKYKIKEIVGDGVLILQCASCPATYRCTGVYPISVDFPGATLLPEGQVSIKLMYKSGLEESDGQTNGPGQTTPPKQGDQEAE